MRVLLLCLAALALTAAPAVASPGDLDSSFGSQGVFVGAGGTPMDRIGDLAQLEDGSLLAFANGQRFGSYGGVLAKLRPDGNYDRSFGWDGHAPATAAPYGGGTMLIQPDDRILIVGVRGYESERLVVERFLPNGDLDVSFGDAGRVTLDPWQADAPGNSYFGAAALDSRGRIVFAAPVHGRERTFLGLLRLRADGEVDRSFGRDGIVRSESTGGLDWASVSRVLVYPGGEILVAGGMGPDGRTYDPPGVPALARFRASGRPERGFGRAGLVKAPAGQLGDRFEDVIRLSRGRIVAVGATGEEEYYDDSWVLRGYRRSGAPDRDFGRRGATRIRVWDGKSYAEDSRLSATVVRQPDGKLLVVGTLTRSQRSSSALESAAVARLLSDGARDREFGDDGLISPALGAPARDMYDTYSRVNSTNAVLVLPDERVLLGGSVTRAPPGHPAGSEYEYMLARLTDSVAPRPLRRIPRSIVFTDGEGALTLGCREAGPICWARFRLGRFVNRLVQLDPGESTPVLVELSDRGRRALQEEGRLKVRATLRLRDENGNSNTIRRSVTLREGG